MLSGPCRAATRSMIVSNAKWLKELLDPRIIPKRLIDDARTAHSVFDGRPPEYPELGPIMYGKGQVVITYRGHNTASHFGNMPGHRSQIIRLPDRGIGVAVLTNGGYRNHPVALLIARRVLDDVLQLEPVDWERRLLHELRKAHDETEKLSKAPSAPTAGIDGIPGVYRHPGYPDLEVVRFDRASKEHRLWVRDLPATMSCEQERLTYFGLMPHSLHVPARAITHHNGNVFEYATPFRTYASDGSEKIVPFQLGPKRAVFVNGKLGFGSNFVAVSPPHKYNAGECPMTGQSGDEGGVDIWFDKVLE